MVYPDEGVIDCSDCRNEWLISEKMDDQVEGAFCKEPTQVNGKIQPRTIFHSEIQATLNSKCNKKLSVKMN